jgi:carbonic anhydrase
VRDKDLKDIFEQNVAWKTAVEQRDPEFFDKLGASHKPNYMWIGRFQLCCD